ncbi:hypothetical protein [Ruficoccus sp. ZRK36]|uniref:hypothetical protein n=1 Tax=Ruficoccus sp. ZRK36 TaxID=2866311 RepID=UPI001C72EBF5|nr:hypothetical protein [Ruficoccus sp. ZRK36]QYY36398.1 hypothetical protein K0V07_02760 [Ruficoccus sp. ZRK36]
MSGFDFENFSDGDWDQNEELAWNEYDWQRYLRQNEREISDFLTHYHKLKHEPDHLDAIARIMGWDREEWSPGEMVEDTDFDAQEENERPRSSSEGDMDPYTIHKHPVFIVTHGLYQHLFKCWEMFTLQNQRSISPVMVGRFGASLHAGEINAVMAINALDMGDYNLTICHLKNSLSALNHSLALLQKLSIKNDRILNLFQSETTRTLFDLREVWLRVMNDCREEERRGSDSE